MGCGESKHDVASGNTIKNSKRLGSKKGYETLPSEKPVAGNDIPKTHSVVEEKVKEKAGEIVEAAKDDEKLKPAEEAKVEEKFKEVKEEKEDEKLTAVVKEKDEEEKVKVAEEAAKAEETWEDDKLKVEIISEKEKETLSVEEIIAEEGIPGKSEYNTPVAVAVAVAKDAAFETPKLKDVVVQDNKTETQKEGGGEVKQEIPVKEEKVSTIRAEEEEEKDTIAEETEKVSPTPSINEQVNVASATTITKEETVTEMPATDSKATN